MTRHYRQEFIDGCNAAAGFDIAAWLKEQGFTPNPVHQQRFADSIGALVGREFDTADEASDWLFSEEGQAAIDAWCREGDRFIEIPEWLARPLDQVFGDTTGVDREALPVHQAAQVAAVLDALDLDVK